MKITKIVKKEIEQEVIEDIICNRCSKSCKQSCNFSGLLEYRFNGCYGSYPLEDRTGYIFSICNPCLKEIFNTFKLPVQEIDYINGCVIGEEPKDGELQFDHNGEIIK